VTLTEFLTARLDEDEAIPWRVVPYSCEPGCCAPAGWVGHQCLICDPAPTYGGTVEAITQIAQEHDQQIHQRARVLREVAAKRAIVALHPPTNTYAPLGPDCGACGYLIGELFSTVDWPCPTLRHLAAVYADHPDYREEWRV
jgi:hypothetical protein